MIRVVSRINDWRKLRRSGEFEHRSLGFVPTMGNLHAGHLSLIERCCAENELSVISIFVNPTQFDQQADLEAYPRTLHDDLRMAEEAGVDYVLDPAFSELYPDEYRYKVTESPLSREFCGAHRPGHFDGVLTVVLKLLLLVRPTRTYMGEKDYQQFLLIRDMVEAFFLETEIIPCPIVRDTDGLALSSRNRNLSPEERKLASQFPALLKSPGTAKETAERLRKAGFEVDYVEDFDGRRLAAVRIGQTRLIDNIDVP